MKRSLIDIRVVDNGEADQSHPFTVVYLTGVLDISTIDELGTVVRPHLRTDAEVIVDLSGVTLCDSTGLGAVVTFERHARAAGCRFAVRSPQPHVAEVFSMTGIDQVVRVYSETVPP
jgi:anti-sigma B factor antagonist